MKTQCEIEFEEIIKSVRAILKPLQFKKQRNNFYRELDDIGQLINFQKSSFGSKDDIIFTINIGIFDPKHWHFFNKSDISNFPKEYECVLRKRIGYLKANTDIWYCINEEKDLQNTIISDITAFVLPFFEMLNSAKKLLEFMDTNTIDNVSDMNKMKFFIAHNQMDKAKKMYEKLLENSEIEEFTSRIIEYEQKYQLDK
ncbi:MAG: DUF4304 domain-containing protein [Flavobacteriaceae bacterium]|nr:DUF4304 domain-containing protein [Flavobacteriaceae bacterium]